MGRVQPKSGLPTKPVQSTHTLWRRSHFKKLLADTIGEIQRAYEALKLPFTNESRAGIEHYMASRPRTKHGKHEYAYADVVDLDHERKRYANYVRYYNIEEER